MKNKNLTELIRQIGHHRKIKAEVSRVSPSSERICRANTRNVSFHFFYSGQFTLSTKLIDPSFCVSFEWSLFRI